MSDKKKHANDDYVNPGSATAVVPAPTPTFPQAAPAGESVAATEARDAEAVKARGKSK